MAKGTVNKVILLGRLGNDPEVRQTQSGTTVATLSLATNEVFKEDTQTEWHRVVVFGKGADVIQKYCKKGDQLYVEGRIRTNKWQDSSGENRYSTEIIANNFQFIGSASQDGNRPTANFDNYPEATQETHSVNDKEVVSSKVELPSFNEINNNFDDDIPF